MEELHKFRQGLYSLLKTQADDDIIDYWDGSINSLKGLIEQIEDEEMKIHMDYKLQVLIDKSQKKYPKNSKIYDTFRERIIDVCLEIPDLCNSTREELILHPFIFDYLTVQSLTDQELLKYNKEQNNRKDDYYKKNKKKVTKNIEEEQKEINEYKMKFFDKVKYHLLDKFNNIEQEYLLKNIDDDMILNNRYELTEGYIDELARIKLIKTIKNDGLEGKTVVLRIDIEEYEMKYEDILDEEGNIKNRILKEIDFPNAKETILQTMNFLLDNRVKTVLLLADFGPKDVFDSSNYSMRYFVDYLNRHLLVDQQIYFIEHYDELTDFEMKLENDEYKDNSLLVLENLNSFTEECGYEYNQFTEDIFMKETRSPTITENVNYYNKIKFMNNISKGQIFINDSTMNLSKKYPSILNVQCPIRGLGLRLETQILKLTTFFSINSPNFMLIIGDDNNTNTSTDEMILNNLLTLNAVLTRFKVIYILGKLGLFIIQTIQKQYQFDDKYNYSSSFHLLMKFILVKAHLNNIRIILPEDIRILVKTEYDKFNRLLPTEEQDSEDTNYMKYIKTLFKREKIAAELEDRIDDEDELNDNPDYQKNKLDEEQKELLIHYRDQNIIEFNANQHILPFVEAQQISKPQKILKNDLQVYEYNQYMYNKPIHIDNNNTNIETVSLYDNEQFEVMDYGPKTYENICKHFSTMNCVMWLGSLSPNIVENLYDDYAIIVKAIHDRKNYLKERFNEFNAEEEKKLHESDLKAKKLLFNVFLKSKTCYELIKSNYRSILSLLQGNNPNVK